MKTAVIVGCGAYLENAHACPGDWKCFKAAAMGDGQFREPHQVIAFVRCQCPGRTAVANTGFAIKLAEIKPDTIYLSTCMIKAQPGCPYGKPEELARILQEKTGVPVVLGTHEYP